MKRASFPHQVEGKTRAIDALQNASYVNYVHQHVPARCFLLYDEPGLGKTRQALEIGLEMSNKIDEGQGILIICPAACIPVWEKEIAKDFSDRFNDVRIYQGQQTRRETLKKPLTKNSILIVSYTSLLSLCKVYFNKHVETGTLPNEDLERYCEVNDKSLIHLQRKLEGDDYRRELLRYVKDIYQSKRRVKVGQQVWEEFFKQQPWRIMIMDEIHKVKNDQSERTKAIGLVRATYRLGLSGTPIVNHPSDLFSILKYGLGLFHVQWKNILSNPNGSYWDELMSSISLGRRKEDIMELQNILPKRMKEDEEKLLEWTDEEQKRVYIRVKKESINIYHDMVDSDNKVSKRDLKHSFMAKIQQLRQICLHQDLPKYMINEQYIPYYDTNNWSPATHPCFPLNTRQRVFTSLLIFQKLFPVFYQCKRLLNYFLKCFVHSDLNMIQPSLKMRFIHQYLSDFPSEKIVCFCSYRVFLEYIMMPWLTQLSIPSVLFCGKNKSSQKNALERFEKEKEVRVLLVVKSCGGEGLNLQEQARACFIMDPHFNLATDEQAAQRIDRIGQTREVKVFKLFMKGSIDEALRQMQHRKQKTIDTWTTSTKQQVKSLDVQGLFLEKYDTVK